MKTYKITFYNEQGKKFSTGSCKALNFAAAEAIAITLSPPGCTFSIG